MIKISSIKQAMLQATFFASLFLFASCNGTQNQGQDTTEVAEDHNDAKFDNNRDEKDAQFLVDAAEINLEEIRLGQLAQQNGRTAEVKELGRMMEAAHQKSLNDLTVLAKSKMITIPTSLSENTHDDYKNLYDKSANDFDKAYGDLMVSEHKDAISTFERASTDSQDADIRNWANNSLTELRKHLDHSINFQRLADNQ